MKIHKQSETWDIENGWQKPFMETQLKDKFKLYGISVYCSLGFT